MLPYAAAPVVITRVVRWSPSALARTPPFGSAGECAAHAQALMRRAAAPLRQLRRTPRARRPFPLLGAACPCGPVRTWVQGHGPRMPCQPRPCGAHAVPAGRGSGGLGLAAVDGDVTKRSPPHTHTHTRARARARHGVPIFLLHGLIRAGAQQRCDGLGGAVGGSAMERRTEPATGGAGSARGSAPRLQGGGGSEEYQKCAGTLTRAPCTRSAAITEQSLCSAA